MIKDIDLSNTAILIDFDGTITTEDTNVKLINKHWNEDIEELYKGNKREKMNYVDFTKELFSNIKITEDEYLDFILNEIKMSDGFIEFYEKTKKHNIPIGIVSGGFENGITAFLDKHNLNDINIYANYLEFQGKDIDIDFYHKEDPNCCEIGYCGNCKRTHVYNYKEECKYIIFIGDGMTDKPIVDMVDIVFAKDQLLEYCKKIKTECIPWDNFIDINKIIFNNM